MKNFVSAILLFLIILVWSHLLPELETAGQVSADMPTSVYLGEGAGTYTIDLGWNFIVKHDDPSEFVGYPGPTYTADATDRVWRSKSTGVVPPFAYHVDTIIGEVTTGCLIRYVAIDDDVDDRINAFFLNDTLIHKMDQGMVTEGEFVIPSDGQLLYDANETVGMYLDVCNKTGTRTPTPTSTISETPTPTPTFTPSQTSTLAPTQTPSPHPMDTPTSEPDPISTPTVTLRQTQTPNAPHTSTPDPTIDPTITVALVILETPVSQTPNPTVLPPPDKACLRINFEVGGDEARNGRFQVTELSGRVLYTWDAQDGWADSGWVHDIEITYPSVYVQVFYWANSSDAPVTMYIINPAPGTEYGWISDNICHALEVAWP